MVSYKGLVKDVLYQLEAWSSGMGYLGAKDLETLVKNATFVEITASGLTENHPHDVKIIKKRQTIKQSRII